MGFDANRHPTTDAGGKGKASKLKHHGMSGIEEVADAADAFNGGGIDRPTERERESAISEEGGKWGVRRVRVRRRRVHRSILSFLLLAFPIP